MNTVIKKEIVLYGKYGVGKTTLLNSLKGQVFDITKPYVGTHLTRDKFNIEGYEFNVIDTSGGMTNESIYKLMTPDRIALVMFAANDRTSFHENYPFGAKTIISKLRKQNPNVKIVLCCNKNDEKRALGMLSREKIEKELGLICHEFSLKTDFPNELIQDLKNM